jgi:hypothetical protein
MSTRVEDRTPDRSADDDSFAMPENHLDVIVTPGSVDTSRKASRRTTLIAVISMPLFFLITFSLCFVSATHSPVPYNMAITVSGPSTVTAQIADTVSERADAAFDVTQTTDAAAARTAVEEREAVGAVIVDGADTTTIIASGGGRLAASVVQGVGTEIADELGGSTMVEDVSPLPADDAGGTVPFFFLVICTVGGFLSITGITQAFPKVRVRNLLLTSLGAGIVVPVLGFSMISLFVGYDVTFGTIMGAIGVGMIYTFTIGILSTLFTTILGQAAVFAQILFLIALNFPAAGGSAPESMLPPLWQIVHNSWVGPGAFESIRSILFFDGNGLGRWLIQLVIWTGGSLLMLALAARAKNRRATTANQGKTAEDNPSSDVKEDQQDVTTAATPAVAGSV